MALLYKRAKGSLAEKEDYWHINKSEDGKYQIKHEWAYFDRNTLSSNDGNISYSVEDFLAADEAFHAPEYVKDKLRAYLEGDA